MIGVVLLVIAIGCFLYCQHSSKSNIFKEKRSRSDFSDIIDKGTSEYFVDAFSINILFLFLYVKNLFFS